MSNFDFLKDFNKDLSNIGNKLEEDVIESPRAVPADATLFLETLVKDIYRLSKTKLKSDELPFYQKIDFLYRSGVITYIYKNKLQDAYNLRNKIHRNYKNTAEEAKIALDLHQRLYYISKKYFRDYSGAKYLNIPDYKKPDRREIHFKNCIVCGEKNTNLDSNMCRKCNEKIENANYLRSIKNSLDEDDLFKKEDLLEYGLNESEILSLIMNLTKEKLIFKKGMYYAFNEEFVNLYLQETDQYIKITILINKFYKNEISAGEIRETIEYWRGSKNQKPCVEFYRLVNNKIESDFEKAILDLENIERSVKKSSISRINIIEWFNRQKERFIKGDINEAFIKFNELMIDDYFRYRKKGYDENKIKKTLKINNNLLDFWSNHFMGEDFFKKTSEIKKELILKEIKKDKSLSEVLKSCGISQKEFEKLYIISKNENSNFYNNFVKDYTLKRQKLFIKNLTSNYLSRAIRKSKITYSEFMKWYFNGENNFSDFYIKTTKLLMNQYLEARKMGLNKKDLLKELTLPKEILKSWEKQSGLKLFDDFKRENEEITSNLLKRGLIINALKEDKSKKEAIEIAKITPDEFEEIYNTSLREKTDFYQRFNMEYMKNRKRLFSKLLKDNDFYNSIVKCEITQKEFNKWYQREESEFLEGKEGCEFYITTTRLLMDKYIDERRDGKNRPDAARSIGLSNTHIDKWLKRPEFDLYNYFIINIEKLHIYLIKKAFKQLKSKMDVYRQYDISVKTIETYINNGKNGSIVFKEIYELYENTVIPHQLNSFLEEFENKPFKRSLKNVNLSEKELKYYYNRGKNTDDAFRQFHEDYLCLKIKLYVNSILSKKSHRISLKNSQLSKEEFKDYENKIEEFILNSRLNLLNERLIESKTTTSVLSSLSGVSVEELYRWYFKGKNGDERFDEYSEYFELNIITPKTMAINRALALGISKNKLLKKLRKDIGEKDFNIWKENSLIDTSISPMKLDDNFDREAALESIQNSDFIQCCFYNDDPEIEQLMRKAARSNVKSFGNLNIVEFNKIKEDIIGSGK